MSRRWHPISSADRFRDGDIIGATTEDKSEPEVVYAFLGWTHGHFKLVPGDPGEGVPIAQSVRDSSASATSHGHATVAREVKADPRDQDPTCPRLAGSSTKTRRTGRPRRACSCPIPGLTGRVPAIPFPSATCR